MAVVIGRIAEVYHYLNDEISDPRALDYPLMKNPLKVLLLLIFYLYFVLKWGPKYMEKRKPFNLERILIVFNVAQIAVCSYMFISAMSVLIPMKHNWLCQPMDYSRTPYPMHLVKMSYIYFLTKILDLLDTVFFILRKKDNQVTFLHVYHHGGMLLLTWIGVKYLPGGHGVTVGILNSFVHVAMYTYYLLSSFDSKYKNNIWWKKHITQLQLIQFFILTLHFLVLFFIDCGFPQFTAYFMLPQNIFMLAMFGDFYIKAYIKPSTPADQPHTGSKSHKLLNGSIDSYLDAMNVSHGNAESNGIAKDYGKSE
ncbi:elongation of very long chain fatty acids protein AAEL008004-like [Lutzomyia longipalpis]|uniref:elongation of very long chain fatty acids protein AAEL008004-like n=1 Tax=Lutzomyia longipalpis TaxID=7200 RepID=UPI002483DF68|nr:elongation of very long chain fatty acids protein AAEL008004-like [Lutzomyia longipalpis]